MAQIWLVGAAINLVGSIMINLGTNIMKLGHNRKAAIENITGKKYKIRKFREWQVGVFLFIIGNLANFISFGYAAQSLLSALGSIQFVSNVIFAALVLKEKITGTIVFATGCIVFGCIMLVTFGSHISKQLTVEELMILYTRPAYILYLLFLGTCVIAMYLVYKSGKGQMKSYGLSELTILWYRLLPLSYALFSGLIGTQSVLFSKTLSTLLRVTLSGNNQLGSWFTWTIIFVFLVSSSFWISRLNKALKLFPAMIIVPTMQISWTLFSVISGMLYFEEYKDFSAIQGIFFALAIMIVFFGVFLLTRNKIIEPHENNGKYFDDISGKKIDKQDLEINMVNKVYAVSVMEDFENLDNRGEGNHEDLTEILTLPTQTYFIPCCDRRSGRDPESSNYIHNDINEFSDSSNNDDEITDVTPAGSCSDIDQDTGIVIINSTVLLSCRTADSWIGDEYEIVSSTIMQNA